MAIVQQMAKPDLFVTMTCNPYWPEITSQLLHDQTPQDRPDLTARVFHAKLDALKKDLYQNGVLGRVIGRIHVIEFQKRGLPHAHILLILHPEDKLQTPEDFDRVVRAELPDAQEEPRLFEVVRRHMMHGPCGPFNPRAPCMENGVCKNDTHTILFQRPSWERIPTHFIREGPISGIYPFCMSGFNPNLILRISNFFIRLF